ncbi:ParB N-terminal domain-containing protein [Nonomuraea sp. NPDC050790]|uniref:ParB N-terminal domain-containing protein n=1 Tax=Nonomuraea sp. NPDC050790 TaxID=3364371 RepID=UPI00379152BA
MSDCTTTGQPAPKTPATAEAAAPTTPEPGPVDSSEVEWFQILAWRWNITTAKQLAKDREPQARLDPAAWKAMLGVITINTEHAARVDLTEPLIVAPVPNGGMLIIDGWHRLHKALNTGVTELQAVILTAEEELACRIFGGEPHNDDGYDEYEEYDEDEHECAEDGLADA